LKFGNDASDAGWIAEQLRLGILPESYVYPPEARPIRDLLKRRMLIVHQRVQSLSSLESLFARHGWQWRGAQRIKSWTAEDLKALQADVFTEVQTHASLEMIRKQDGISEWIEKTMMKAVKPQAEYQRIQNVPGIGSILGMVVVLESGGFTRFASAGDYASYCRTVLSERTSNGRRKGESNRRHGNPYLAWAFAEAAVFAVRFYPKIAAWYERKKRRRSVPVAMKALACKLAKAAWHVMRGKEFEESMLFG